MSEWVHLVESLEPRTLFAAAPTILFIRGAAGSGGFLEADVSTRNQQLADINDTSTAANNTGWATLAQTLRDAGFNVVQLIEPKGAKAPVGNFNAGKPIPFEKYDLSRYAAIVFGSNNAQYPKASVDAVEKYIKNGGGALFIADANFGSDWQDAANSDQAFLNRFGLIQNQDFGTYPLTRAGGDFVSPNHPVLSGVNSFDGEGVNPVSVPKKAPAGVKIVQVVKTQDRTRENNGGGHPSRLYKGGIRPAVASDSAVVLANAGRGRVATYFDRNTFFNANGKGTNITRFDNKQLASNLFGWVADNKEPAVSRSAFTLSNPYNATLYFDDNLMGSLTKKDVLLLRATDGSAVPSDRWTLSVIENNGKTEASVWIDGLLDHGGYYILINPGKIADEAGNLNTKRIRFDITLRD
ncbi:MAG TPA: hypothetical protein VF669_15855 [Tepidisphaeraceae bacterium]|jgi:hypothetical protein